MDGYTWWPELYPVQKALNFWLVKIILISRKLLTNNFNKFSNLQGAKICNYMNVPTEKKIESGFWILTHQSEINQKNYWNRCKKILICQPEVFKSEFTYSNFLKSKCNIFPWFSSKKEVSTLFQTRTKFSQLGIKLSVSRRRGWKNGAQKPKGAKILAHRFRTKTFHYVDHIFGAMRGEVWWPFIDKKKKPNYFENYFFRSKFLSQGNIREKPFKFIDFIDSSGARYATILFSK